MLKKIFLVIACGIFFSGCSITPRKSGIEIIGTPETKIFLDDKEVGTAPYKNNNLTKEEIKVKLKAANNQEWVKKIELQNNSNTVIDWEFGNEEKESGGYLLYLEKTGDNKKAGLMINAIPDKAAVAVDGEIKGLSPFRLENIGDGDKQITISFPGYKTINVFIRAIKGYQSVIEAKLAEEKAVIPENTEIQESSPSAKTTIPMITIGETETGWLRVRASASSAASEIAKVKPGEKYKLIEEQNDWYKIDLDGNKSGWISTKYAVKSQ